MKYLLDPGISYHPFYPDPLVEDLEENLSQKREELYCL
jgi:hypothetical protein